jgi:thioredoxin domain-containing protein 5
MPIEDITNSLKAKDTFEKCLNNKKVLCLFYWKLCGHCVEFMPIWNKVVNIYKDVINVVQIELECVKKLDKKYKINGFPTIVIFNNGNKEVEFIKSRNFVELNNFIKTHLLEYDTQAVKSKTPVKPKSPVKPKLNPKKV